MQVTFCTWCGVTPGTQSECIANKHNWYTSNSPYCFWCGMAPGSTPTHCTASKHYWQESPKDRSNDEDQSDRIGAAVVEGTLSAIGLGLIGLGITAGMEAISDKADNVEKLETNATILAIYELQKKNVLTYDFLVANLSGENKPFKEASKAIIYISKLVVNGTLIISKQGDINTFRLNPEDEIVKKIISNAH